MNYTAKEIAQITNSKIIGNKKSKSKILLLTAELFILQKYCISCDQYQKNSGQKYMRVL
jgi:alanine racemase